MIETTNLKLQKAELNESYSLSQHNDNLDKIDKIVEEVFTADGGYVKYANGTLICWQNPTTQSLAVGLNERIWTYPHPFIYLPNIQFSVGVTGVRVDLIKYGINFQSTATTISKVTTSIYNEYTSPLTAFSSLLAIGRWK